MRFSASSAIEIPGTVVLPTGYGELLFGVAKGFRELKEPGVSANVPRMLSAEPAVRGPLAHAMARNEAAAEVTGPPSLAAGIACTVSSYRGLVALRETAGRALTFHESTLIEATRELARDGLWQEYSGAAGLAALFEAGGAARPSTSRWSRCSRRAASRTSRNTPHSASPPRRGGARPHHRVFARGVTRRWLRSSVLAFLTTGAIRTIGCAQLSMLLRRPAPPTSGLRHTSLRASRSLARP